MVGDPEFIEPEQGDFRVKPTSPALRCGFVNFSMTAFGPTLPPFQTKMQHAYRRYRPALMWAEMTGSRPGFPHRWQGAILKNLSTEAEKSATGMPEITGVLVVELPPDSAAGMLGLQENDVILAVNGQPVDTLQDFLQFMDHAATREENTIRIFRYQKPLELDW